MVRAKSRKIPRRRADSSHLIRSARPQFAMASIRMEVHRNRMSYRETKTDGSRRAAINVWAEWRGVPRDAVPAADV